MRGTAAAEVRFFPRDVLSLLRTGLTLLVCFAGSVTCVCVFEYVVSTLKVMKKVLS